MTKNHCVSYCTVVFLFHRPNIFKNLFGTTSYVKSLQKRKRYFEPAPQDIDVENFKKVIQSRRSVRKFTKKAIPAECT